MSARSPDSGREGPFRWCEQRGAGWYNAGGVLYSPVLTAVPDIPRDHLDEWYVLDRSMHLPDVEVFINPAVFTLVPRALQIVGREGVPARWASSSEDARRRFWRQFERLGAVTYLAQADDGCIVASRPRGLGARAAALRA